MKKGSLVTCIYRQWFLAKRDLPVLPKKDHIYTVESVVVDKGEIFVTLEEIPAGPTGKPLFFIGGFREIQKACEGTRILQLMMEEEFESHQLTLLNQIA